MMRESIGTSHVIFSGETNVSPRADKHRAAGCRRGPWVAECDIYLGSLTAGRKSKITRCSSYTA